MAPNNFGLTQLFQYEKTITYMENNTDIIVLTSVIIVLFVVFIIATIREFNTLGSKEYVPSKEGGPRAEILRFVGKIFTDESIEPNEKITIMNAMKPLLKDLQTKEDKDNV